jgi:hypothetical protein
MIAADILEGKTIERIESHKWDEFLIIFFTDKTCLVVIAEQCNAAGAKISYSFGELAYKKGIK